jgi:hypothetical protein
MTEVPTFPGSLRRSRGAIGIRLQHRQHSLGEVLKTETEGVLREVVRHLNLEDSSNPLRDKPLDNRIS